MINYFQGVLIFYKKYGLCKTWMQKEVSEMETMSPPLHLSIHIAFFISLFNK
jgi:hypothetical protein